MSLDLSKERKKYEAAAATYIRNKKPIPIKLLRYLAYISIIDNNGNSNSNSNNGTITADNG